MGSMYYRGDMIWLAYNDATGKRRNRSSGLRRGQETQARRILEAIEATVQRGAPVEAPQPDTLAAYAARWCEGRKTQGIATAGDEEARLRDHVLPVLGHLPLDELRPRHVRDLVRALQTKEARRRSKDEPPRTLAPRTVRHCYATLHRLLQDAVAEERIATNPCALKRHELPGKIDADPEWRAGAVFTRAEVEALLSSEEIPEDRRTLYALLFLGGLRFGEAAALRWRAYDQETRPLGRLVIAASWSTNRKTFGRTKTEATRQVPVHPELAKLLAAWQIGGWARLMGRAVGGGPDDLLIPSRLGRPRSSSQALKRFHEDLERLGLRRRRLHDARRTFISLALADGARKDVLRWVTHGPSGDVVDLYTTLPWAALCEAVGCLRLNPPELGGGGRVIPLRRSAAVAAAVGDRHDDE